METMEMERFEPYGHGVTTDEHLKVDKLIEKAFRSRKINIKFISPYQFIPEKSFQEYEETEGTNKRKDDPGGFCGVWGIWYVNLRLKFPEAKSEDLIKQALKLIKGKKNFKNFIRNYSAFLVRMRNNMLDKNLSKYSNKSLTKKIDNILIERNLDLLINNKKNNNKKNTKKKNNRRKKSKKIYLHSIIILNPIHLVKIVF